MRSTRVAALKLENRNGKFDWTSKRKVMIRLESGNNVTDPIAYSAQDTR